MEAENHKIFTNLYTNSRTHNFPELIKFIELLFFIIIILKSQEFSHFEYIFHHKTLFFYQMSEDDDNDASLQKYTLTTTFRTPK